MYTCIHGSYYSCICAYSFEADIFTEWATGIEAIAKASLEKPLLVWEQKDNRDLLKVNFDPSVSYCGIIKVFNDFYLY